MPIDSLSLRPLKKTARPPLNEDRAYGKKLMTVLERSITADALRRHHRSGRRRPMDDCRHRRQIGWERYIAARSA